MEIAENRKLTTLKQNHTRKLSTYTCKAKKKRVYYVNYRLKLKIKKFFFNSILDAKSVFLPNSGQKDQSER